MPMAHGDALDPWQHGGDLDSFLAGTVDMDRFIDAVVATYDHVGAKPAEQQAPQRSKS
jgi:hypothetical protein